MKNLLSCCLLTWMVLSFQWAVAQDVEGIWQNFHPETGAPLSLVRFYEQDGKIHAQVLRILSNDVDIECAKCSGERKDREIEGMEVIWDLQQAKPSFFKNGRILDPESGKVYKCLVKIVDKNRIKVRAYLGLRTLGKTLYMSRVDETEQWVVDSINSKNVASDTFQPSLH